MTQAIGSGAITANISGNVSAIDPYPDLYIGSTTTAVSANGDYTTTITPTAGQVWQIIQIQVNRTGTYTITPITIYAENSATTSLNLVTADTITANAYYKSIAVNNGIITISDDIDLKFLVTVTSYTGAGNIVVKYIYKRLK